MPNALYDSLFARHEDSERIFLQGVGTPETSYGEFLQMAARLANSLAKTGVEPGDRVAVQVRKSVEALALYAACVKAGAVFLPLNTGYMATEIDYFVNDAGARLLVCDPAAASALEPVAKSADAALLTLGGAGDGTLAELMAGQPETFSPIDRGTDDLAAILYTSGTTGRSKGAMLTHRNLLSNAEALIEYWRFTGDDVLLHALPIFHTHGLFVATNVIVLAGGSMIFQPGFDVNAVIAALPRATTMMGVPTFYTRLLADARFDRKLVEHMRLFTSGSAPLLAETHIAFEERTGHRILERYGMTETNMNTSNPYDGERRAGTVGFPLPGVELRICDPETGKEVAKGDIGVIEVRGPNVFKGYWNMPEKTKEEFRDDGFFITGDLAHYDEDGYVQIVGRAKDLIISGGYNIYPKEVELLIDDLPGVVESAVIGVPHPDFGEGVVAVVVPESNGSFNEQAIMDAIREKVARFKQPKRIFSIDELPRNTMGKVQKNELRKTYSDCFSA
jgi:malonyl-CoA/methylmalonyl-CoA synthetase